MRLFRERVRAVIHSGLQAGPGTPFFFDDNHACISLSWGVNF